MKTLRALLRIIELLELLLPLIQQWLDSNNDKTLQK